jgi:hypothetical protein
LSSGASPGANFLAPVGDSLPFADRDPDDRLLDDLGIRDAVLVYIRDEDAWVRRRTATRRKARLAGRDWIAEAFPECADAAIAAASVIAPVSRYQAWPLAFLASSARRSSSAASRPVIRRRSIARR